MISKQLDASCRVALAAYLHDMGKFAERAGAFDRDARLDGNLQLYCPFHRDGNWFSHRHAAHTALAFDLIERHLPDLLAGDVHPFVGRSSEGGSDVTDSLINASAAHHKPSTFLQWIIATADRVASGFEREEFDRYNEGKDETRTGLDHFSSRQLTLFEQIRLSGEEPAEQSLQWRYPLAVLSPLAIFPQLAKECEGRDRGRAKTEYRALWEAFVGALERIPGSHRSNLALWLDHFDSLWLTYTHAIPAATAFGVRPEVSLYDHSRTTAALAVALWRWHGANEQVDAAAAERHRARADFAEEKLLLVQGDFFGIQEFIFATGGETRKRGAKMLRGRSFQVSLFTELAALRILDALGLPPTSQVINAAGKFLIVAPNTPEIVSALQGVKRTLDVWFLEQSFGQAGIGIAWLPAACADFLRKPGQFNANTPFAQLLKRLHGSLDEAKFSRFDLCASGARVFERDFPYGPCAYNGRVPADRAATTDEKESCALSRDQIAIGDALVKFDRMLVLDAGATDALSEHRGLPVLELALFGYRVAFTHDEAESGKFGQLARAGSLRRCWDFSLPSAGDTSGASDLWSGYARRFVSGFVPRVSAADHSSAVAERYAGAIDEGIPPIGELETLDMIACEDRTPDPQRGGWRGIAALGILKGDLDDLGEIFRVGLRQPSFAKYAALSRQVNGFFAIYLPWLLAREFPRTYTVFAGGDDFFLIGPWGSTQALALRLHEEFARYVASNPGIHFSAGIATEKPGSPIRAMGALADDALKTAKRGAGKNSVTCFGETVPWAMWPQIAKATARLEELCGLENLSTAFVYGLLQFVKLRRLELDGKPEAAMWRSRFAYRTRRFVVDKRRGLDEQARHRLHTTISDEIGAKGIGSLGHAYRITLFNYLYRNRSR